MNDQKSLDQLTIPQMLVRSRDRYGDRVAMNHFDGESFKPITYDDYYFMVRQAAAALKKAGIKADDKVAILSVNQPAWGAVYFASLFLDAVNVPLDANLKIAEWSYIIRNSRSKVVVVSEKILPEIEPLLGDIETLDAVICMDRDDGKTPYLLEGKNPAEINPPDVNIDKLAALLYTSGTTGLAKGVMLSHGNITSDVYGIELLNIIIPEDNFISILPIHHTFECTVGFLMPLALGASITYARGLASKLIVEDIKSNAATVLVGVPLVFEKMYIGMMKAIEKKPPFTRAIFRTIYGLSRFLKKSANVEAGGKLFGSLREKAGLTTLRLMAVGGAPMSPVIAEAFNSLGFRMIQGYGLTESSPVITFNPPDNYRNASLGMALPGAEIKLINVDTAGVGEIAAKGPMIMKGYYKNEKATAEVLKDGWLHTGDLARVDAEGFYYIAGRRKSLIVTPGGKNVYPEEIEFALSSSPFILESLVLGRPLPDSGGGEEIEAIIVPDLDYFAARAEEKSITLTEEYLEKTIKLEVLKQCEHLADYKRVKYVIIRDEDFEKTSTRKIKRYLYEHKPMVVPKGKSKGE
ncbi:MAG: AMP-binding protein [candidate division Zixibacteria bacterium]|nr:AMP-binding protein [candidate division Zixibacteria bacterium]